MAAKGGSLKMQAAKTLLPTVLIIIFLCCEQIIGTGAAPGQPGGMTAVINTVTIKGPPKAVFDLITTARLWPQWHPATKATGGVVERPYALGDLIHERGQISNADFKTTWKVLEHVRPSKVVLQSQNGPTRIT
jgi:hypothetical protein